MDAEMHGVIFPQTKHIYQAFRFPLGCQPFSRVMDLFILEHAHAGGAGMWSWGHTLSRKKPRLGRLTNGATQALWLRICF